MVDQGFHNRQNKIFHQISRLLAVFGIVEFFHDALF